MATLRGYLNKTQMQHLTGVDLGDDADKIISKAEAIIDGLLGNHRPFVGHVQGVLAGVVDGKLSLSPDHVIQRTVGYYNSCVVEMMTGNAAGEFHIVTSSDENGILTLDEAFSIAPQAGDVYHVYQMGKFPRFSDVSRVLGANSMQYTTRTIPSRLRDAVAAQVLYMQELGDDYFNGNSMNMDSENFGSYSYNKSESAKGSRSMVAPKAREALAGSGLINRTGTITGY